MMMFKNVRADFSTVRLKILYTSLSFALVRILTDISVLNYKNIYHIFPYSSLFILDIIVN